MIANATRPPAPSGAPAKNLVLIVLDTVRADAFRTVDPSSKVQTPTFDALASTGVAFANAFNNENWTKPSVATILAGVYPETHDTRFRESVLPDEVELVSEHLQKQGFATAAVIANRVISGKFGFDQGWDSFLRAVGADNLYDEAIAWLTQRDASKRFFLYLQPFDPHIPYEAAPELSSLYYEGEYKGPLGPSFDTEEQAAVNEKKSRLSDDDMRWVRALYDGEITFHDREFGRFIEYLRTSKLLDDTLIVFTNDHGEEFGEHNLLGHGWSLYDTLLRAPLLFHYPSMLPPGRKVDAVVEHVDLVASSLDVLGVEPMTDGEGLSLLPLIRGQSGRLLPHYSVTYVRGTREGRSVHVGRWKYSRGGRLWAGLYDLAADPGETKNLIGKLPIAARLGHVYLGEALATRKKVDRLSDVTATRQFQSVRPKLDEKTRKELEALGYFGE
jgi:arylsulfatase A-like enzyme